MIRPLALSLVLATPAAAGYSENPITQAFRDAPCGEVIAAIDTPDMGPAIASGDLKLAVETVARQVGYFGFIVGFDNAAGGIQGDHETTLMRLRAACAAAPETPALDLLRGF